MERRRGHGPSFLVGSPGVSLLSGAGIPSLVVVGERGVRVHAGPQEYPHLLGSGIPEKEGKGSGVRERESGPQVYPAFGGQVSHSKEGGILGFRGERVRARE